MFSVFSFPPLSCFFLILCCPLFLSSAVLTLILILRCHLFPSYPPLSSVSSFSSAVLLFLLLSPLSSVSSFSSAVSSFSTAVLCSSLSSTVLCSVLCFLLLLSFTSPSLPFLIFSFLLLLSSLPYLFPFFSCPATSLLCSLLYLSFLPSHHFPPSLSTQPAPSLQIA